MTKVSKISIIIVAVIAIMAVFTFALPKNGKNENNSVSIQVVVYDKDEKELYNNKTVTKENTVLKVLKTLSGLEILTEEGPYGEYINSINGVKEGESYYWNYYVNDEYASVGVENCMVHDNDVYKFKLEKFE